MKVFDWYGALSTGQRRLGAATLAAMVVIACIGLFLPGGGPPVSAEDFTPAQSIREIAPRLDVTGPALARELGLPIDVPKGKPLAALGVSAEGLTHAIEHLLSHRSTATKYFLFAALVLGAAVYMSRLGRPAGLSGAAARRVSYPRAVHVGIAIVAVVACGFLLGKSPNPMEGLVKVLKSGVGLYPDPWAKVAILVFFLALATVANKVLCGWACPFGAVQELLYSLPVLRKRKRSLRISTRVTEGVRLSLFVLTVLLLFGVINGRKGFVAYHFLNPFNLFSLSIESVFIGLTILVSVLAAAVVYRPYCRFVCPFGLVSRLAEKVSLLGVRIDREACTDCGACAKACPTSAMADRLAGRVLPADCFSCGRCLNVCPTDAVSYARGACPSRALSTESETANSTKQA